MYGCCDRATLRRAQEHVQRILTVINGQLGPEAAAGIDLKTRVVDADAGRLLPRVVGSGSLYAIEVAADLDAAVQFPTQAVSLLAIGCVSPKA